MMPQIPVDCPRCGKRLYPIVATRPQPRMSFLALGVLLIAGIVSVVVYCLIFQFIEERTAGSMPRKLVALIAVVPALLPGIAIALPLNRLPNVLSLRCSRCKWDGKYAVPRSGVRAKSMTKTGLSSSMGLGSARVMPQPTDRAMSDGATGTEVGLAVDDIVEDRHDYDEIRAWIYAEFISGRSFDDISAEMLAGGWSGEEVDALVEEGRKVTRDRRP